MKLMHMEVGKPFPGPVPAREGAVLELVRGGPAVMIQMPGLTRAERMAFKKSFDQYAYLETGTPVPVAVWVFRFPAPFGAVDVNFNARLVRPEIVSDYLETENGRVKNTLNLFLLDGKILRGIKLVGLDPDAVRMFHDTIRRQLAMDYSAAEFDRYLNGVMAYSTDELYRMGTRFRK